MQRQTLFECIIKGNAIHIALSQLRTFPKRVIKGNFVGGVFQSHPGCRRGRKGLQQLFRRQFQNRPFRVYA